MPTTIIAPPALIGVRGQDLTGVECRILRAALGLERRHVSRFAQAMGYGTVDPTPERITAWEKAKGRGYPADLVAGLTALEGAVEAWARMATEEAAGSGAYVLLRPLGYRYAFAQLGLAGYGLTLTPDQLIALDDINGEIWLALADAAIARAALYLRRPGGLTRIELDREPELEHRGYSHGEAVMGRLTAAADNRVTFDVLADRPRNIYRDPKA
jgi:hypothetical protein